MSRYRMVSIGTLAYVLFCSLVLTPLDDTVILWPYPLLVATQGVTGLSTADPFDYIAADGIGLVIVSVFLHLIQRRMGRYRPSWGLAVAVGAWIWMIPLILLQTAAWLVGITLLGGRNV